jgi:hypothetical protein
VEFSNEEEAEAFKRQFDGTESESLSPGGHDCEKRCWWRLTAEDIRAEADEFACESARETWPR